MFKSFASLARASSLAIAASVMLAPASLAAQDEVITDKAAPRDTTEIQNQQAETARRGLPIKANFNQAEDLENVLFLDISTGERIAIRLVPEWAPNHVERIKTLTRRGFYDGLLFHRVIDGFMAQSGDPTGTGGGGSDLPDLEAEFTSMPHVRGTLSMARADDENSANSQFFIVFYPRFALDRRYTNFGRVIGNMAAADAIERGEPPVTPTYIVQASLGADSKPQKLPTAPALPQPIAIAEDLASS